MIAVRWKVIAGEAVMIGYVIDLDRPLISGKWAIMGLLGIMRKISDHN